MIRLQKDYKISASEIAKFTKGYMHYKSGFDAIRAKNKPKIPKELDDFNFDNKEFEKFRKTIHKKEFLQYDNLCKDGKRSMIFASEAGVKLLSNSTRWQSDGTFFCAPKPFKQAYYIMGGAPGEKLLPVVYILMQSRTYIAYEDVFSRLKACAERYGVSLAPRLVLLDFEKAARKALKFSFPGIKIKGSFFHNKQAFGRWIFKNGYKVTYAINLEFNKWLNKLASLAIVPIQQIDDAWHLIVSESNLLSDINVQRILKYFFT